MAKDILEKLKSQIGDDVQNIYHIEDLCKEAANTIENLRKELAAKPEVTDTKKQLLNDAYEIISKDRQATHGGAEDNFQCIAELWQSYKGINFDKTDVAIMMCQLKIARIRSNPFNRDNYLDLIGYATLAYEMNQGYPVGEELTDEEEEAESLKSRNERMTKFILSTY